MTSSNPQPIRIDVHARYLAEQSVPDAQRYAFAYTITITNTGDESVRLLSRHWVITDANNQIKEVRGDGVVGEQPLIPPGHSYEYTSGAILETQVGTMEGSYQMRSASGRAFLAPIAPFILSKPGTLH
ncbi:MAG TPA: Co2+/Mg2+ efflux protein ApaG [Spongiibacteraceae bacterium]|jgi:ApaG protein|nr:Co2+/Mg2+ efflux protein ApaG [Spongiibacteraceae bacterium]HUH37486.1 Co2+/Mg2+ efflux protein ApaG [Spongiibacteraceae bacterium]